MNPRCRSLLLLLTGLSGSPVLIAAEAADAETAAGEQSLLSAPLGWIHGPTQASIGEVGVIQVPSGYVFTGPKGTQEILQLWGNPVDGDELGFLAPTSLVWSVVFEWDEAGYVKDDDKDKLDPDAMLKVFQEGAKQGNAERRRRGWAELNIVGWETPPRYHEETHNLEWAIKGVSEGTFVINYNVRLLGRKGVMSATLLVDPEDLGATLPAYRALLGDYGFKQGERYAEYRQGDKLAQYGLAALVVGGAAAGAAKLGLFAWLAVFLKKGWKLLIVGVVAVAAGLRKLIHGGRRSQAE